MTPDDDPQDRAMRAATNALLDWQLSTEARLDADPLADAAALQAFFDARSALRPSSEQAGWQRVIAALISQAAASPQVALREQPARRAALTHDLAALLRPADTGHEESRQLDWAIRYWERARAAGLLQGLLAEDFGEFWRRVEWSGLQQHLALLAAPHPHERRLLAYVAQVSARYVDLAPIKRLIEVLHPELFDLGFALR